MKTILALIFAATTALAQYQSAPPIFWYTPSGFGGGGLNNGVASTNGMFSGQIFVDQYIGFDSPQTPGDVNNPFASISYAMTYLPPGYSLNITRGTFVDNTININSSFGIYVQSGVVITNPTQPFLNLGTANTTTVLIDGRGAFYGNTANFVTFGNVGACSNLTFTINAATINLGGNLIKMSNPQTVENIFFTADNFTVSGNLMSTIPAGSTNINVYIRAKQSLSYGQSGSCGFVQMPPTVAIDLTCPETKLTGTGLANFDNTYVRTIVRSCFLTIPSYSANTNFVFFTDAVRLRPASGWFSAPATQNVFGTTNNWW